MQFSCRLTLNKVKPGTINTPNYPNNYGNRNHCTWLISSSHRIKLVFTYFSLESGFDYLTVYDGNSAHSKKIGRLAGYRTNKAIQSSGNHLFLKFTSDSSVSKKGFLIHFKGRGICISIHSRSVCLSVCLSDRLSVCLSVRLSVCVSVCPSVCLSVCLSVSVRPSVCRLFVCLSISLSIWLPVCLSIRPFTRCPVC